MLCAVTPERWGDGDDHGVHSGIGHSTTDLYERLKHVLHSLHTDGYAIRLVGHSLGAGVAGLMAWLLKRDGLENVRAICFACPPCASAKMAAETQEYAMTLVMRYDLVRVKGP
jgi:pimeloyl-ACP methyl ester carboxylesterase